MERGFARFASEYAAIENALGPGFAGCSLRPVESRVVRPGPALEVRHIAYADKAALAQVQFVAELHSALSDFSKLETAQFQVTGIDGQRTRLRYELVGEGQGFHREQRVGTWELEWEKTADDRYRLQRWLAGNETRAGPRKPGSRILPGRRWDIRSRCCRASIIGERFSTGHRASTSTAIMACRWATLMEMDSTMLYICQPAGLPNRLYRNRGDGTFEDITEASGVGLLDNTACAIFADFDNDGRQDLIVVRATGPLLFLNQGGGKFRLKPDAFKFAKPPQGTFTGAAAADYDRDGWLDIYFCLYTYYQGAGQYKYPSPYYAAENGPPNFLMRNNRDGTFRDVTAQGGAQPEQHAL